MDEASLRSILGRLGVRILGRSSTGWLQSHCPLAEYTHRKATDRHPSFGVMVNDAGTSAYKCLACGYHGRVSDLVRTLERFRCDSYPGLAADADRADLSGAFGAGYDIIQAMADYDEPEPVDEAAVSGLYPPVWEVPEAWAYVSGRGISEGTAELLELAYDPDDFRIMFPVRGRGGQLYGYTGRSILPEQAYPYRSYGKVRDYLGLPKRNLLLGMNLYQPGKPMLVEEGLFGYAALVEAGVRDICNPVAMLGAEMTQSKASLLSQLEANVYLLPDNDPAGEACLFGRYVPERGDYGGDGAVERLQKKGVILFVPEWPEGKIDPDQLTYEEVWDMINKCPPWTGT